MRVITFAEVRHRDKPEAEEQVFAPGEHDLPDAVAGALIKCGLAERVANAAPKPSAGEVKVEVKGDGPKVTEKGKK